MIQNKLKNCCNACTHRKVYTEEIVMRSNDSIFDIITKIGCEHEEICKEYIEEPLEDGALKGSKKISFYLYTGDELAVAQGIFEYWMEKKNNNVLIPTNGTEFCISVCDVDIILTPEPYARNTKYKVKLKGELV